MQKNTNDETLIALDENTSIEHCTDTSNNIIFRVKHKGDHIGDIPEKVFLGAMGLILMGSKEITINSPNGDFAMTICNVNEQLLGISLFRNGCKII